MSRKNQYLDWETLPLSISHLSESKSPLSSTNVPVSAVNLLKPPKYTHLDTTIFERIVTGFCKSCGRGWKWKTTLFNPKSVLVQQQRPGSVLPDPLYILLRERVYCCPWSACFSLCWLKSTNLIPKISCSRVLLRIYLLHFMGSLQLTCRHQRMF